MEPGKILQVLEIDFLLRLVSVVERIKTFQVVWNLFRERKSFHVEGKGVVGLESTEESCYSGFILPFIPKGWCVFVLAKKDVA